MPAPATSASPAHAIDAHRLTLAVAQILVAVGIKAEDAEVVAGDLVDADLEGLASHGVPAHVIGAIVERTPGGPQAVVV